MVASEPSKPYEPGYPQWLVDAARWVKAVLQMLVGIYTLFWLVRAFVLSPGMHNCAVMNSREQFCYAIPPAAVALQMGEQGSLSFYSVALGALFVVRTFIAPDEDKPPKLWWWFPRFPYQRSDVAGAQERRRAGLVAGANDHAPSSPDERDQALVARSVGAVLSPER